MQEGGHQEVVQGDVEEGQVSLVDLVGVGGRGLEVEEDLAVEEGAQVGVHKQVEEDQEEGEQVEAGQKVVQETSLEEVVCHHD